MNNANSSANTDAAAPASAPSVSDLYNASVSANAAAQAAFQAWQQAASAAPAPVASPAPAPIASSAPAAKPTAVINIGRGRCEITTSEEPDTIELLVNRAAGSAADASLFERVVELQQTHDCTIGSL